MAMGSFAITSIILTLSLGGLVFMIRRNLRQRPKARELRTLFITTLNDLVGKPDFPDAHARQLVQMAALPQGWLTRFMVFQLVKSAVFGERNRRKTPALSFEHVPHHLRALYVTAIFAFLWSDTYRCALFGRVVRSLNSWIMDAIQEVKPDVNAHATRSVVNLVNQVQAPKAFARDDDLVCA